jgi:hypothetical protein
MGQQLVDRVTMDAGHRRDCLRPALAIDNEYRINQVIGGQTVLAHQAAGKFVAAVAAHPALRKSTENIHSLAQVFDRKAAIFCRQCAGNSAKLL